MSLLTLANLITMTRKELSDTSAVVAEQDFPDADYQQQIEEALNQVCLKAGTFQDESSQSLVTGQYLYAITEDTGNNVGGQPTPDWTGRLIRVLSARIVRAVLVGYAGAAVESERADAVGRELFPLTREQARGMIDSFAVPAELTPYYGDPVYWWLERLARPAVTEGEALAAGVLLTSEKWYVGVWPPPSAAYVTTAQKLRVRIEVLPVPVVGVTDNVQPRVSPMIALPVILRAAGRLARRRGDYQLQDRLDRDSAEAVGLLDTKYNPEHGVAIERPVDFYRP